MRFGRTVPDGFLPVFSVGTEKEALDLIVLTCPTNGLGEYIARELAVEQTLENLDAFGDRLRKAHDEVLVPYGKCSCAERKRKRIGKKKKARVL